ncbi:hypothetical protein BBW65_05840 [Helicobacter enhydrae]|uniref:Outer membrane beta-barrel protein n=1 Tax=Helicobacter enhydrae TaxID=222136 RepID=A0A1B1U439_9HELI|nr:hypothetical protein [Helicobacter enhydrae]ANV97492.1 hypothetical protein BBW65_01085 [Helicobacter enhydrae]ANV98351.1 hypothetical protein BBW65_05840 [Helicobacter enhydrae]
MKKKLILFVLLIVGIHSESRADSNDQFLIFSDNLQIYSFLVGSTTSFQDSNSNTSLVLGGSMGINYLIDFVNINEPLRRYGWRLKYLYTFDKPRTQSLGLVYYLHMSYGYLFPSALSLGVGVLWETQEKTRNGIYAETGIALWKTIPVNVDILYRMNMYGRDISHHLNVVFTFF